MSIIHAVEQFRPYVEGNHFTILTDHSALKCLNNTKDPHGRLARWAMRLQQFDYEILYRQGKENVVPDALSRAVEFEDISIIEINKNDKDDWYLAKEEAVKRGELGPDWSIDQGLLWKYIKLDQFPDDNDSWKIVIPEKIKENVFKECHDDPTAGHFGVKKTINRTRQRYYWPSLIKDTKEYVRKCEICAKHKPTQLPPTGLMGKHKNVTEPLQIISMDLMGPFPRSKAGNTMLLVIACWFSKFVFLFPLKNGKVSNIVKIIEEQIFLMYGSPKVIICDNGKQFTASQFKELVASYNSELWYTPYYHPQANPTERINKVIGTTISAYVDDNHKEWDKYIPQIGHAIRTSVHEVTGKTPSYLFLGRETSNHGIRDKRQLSDSDVLQFDRGILDNKLKLQQKIYEDVNTRLRKAYEINSKDYNKRRRVVDYHIGDFVWKRTKFQSSKNKHFMAKLAPKYEKAIIAEKLSPDVYILKSLRGKNLGKWHSSDIKRLL